MLCNHHAHTRFSDGVGEPSDYALRALRQGFDSYTFSDHAPIPLDGAGSMPMDELSAYVAETERLREAYAGRLNIYRSLEVDYLPGIMNVNSRHIREAELDFTVGAVHYVDTLADGVPWSFQRPEPVFAEGIDSIFSGNARSMVERYYALVREMVTDHPPDIVAHLDRIKKRNERERYWSESEDWYRRAVEETLDAIQQAGIIMEVNTRGLYLHEITDTYPSRWIVERAHHRGIPLQINSDAHRAEHISGGFPEAYRMLEEIGVESVRVFRDGGFTEIPVQEFHRQNA